MKNRPVVLQIRRELVDEHKDVADNVAVEVANGSLTELVRHFQAEMKALQEKLLQSVNEKTRKKLEEETRRLQDQMVNMRSDSESMASIYLGVRRRMEEMMREMQEQARRRREQYGVRGRSLQSTPPILPPVSMANKKLQVHDTYYMDDRMIVLSCGGVLFRIPRWHLDKYYPNLLLPGKPDGNNDGVQGTSDDTAIPIGDHISAEEFTIFLNFFYRSIFRKEIPAEEWCRLLAIASKLGCKEVRARAIDELTTRKEEVSPIARIELGNKYDVRKWLPEAYAEAFTRGSHLTTEEGEKLGLEVTVKVLAGRDRCKRNNWTQSGDGNVIRLVKQIFPPPAAPRFAGRAVYKVRRTSSEPPRSRNTTLYLPIPKPGRI